MELLYANPFYGKIYTMEDDKHNDHNSLIKLKQLFEDHVYPNTHPGGNGLLKKPWASLSATQIGTKLVEYSRAIRKIWDGMATPPGSGPEPLWAPNFTSKGVLTHDEVDGDRFWGIISHRKRVDDGQTGALETLLNLYNEICFTHNGMTDFTTKTPLEPDFETYLDLISELEFTWYVSGEKFRGWVLDFCRDIIRGSLGR